MKPAKITYHGDGSFTVDEAGYIDVEEIIEAVEAKKQSVTVTMPYALSQEILASHPAVQGIDRPGKYELEDWVQGNMPGKIKTRIARFERVREAGQ